MPEEVKLHPQEHREIPPSGAPKLESSNTSNNTHNAPKPSGQSASLTTNPSNISSLLAKTSLDLKKERNLEYVDFEEIHGIILGLLNISSGGDAYKQIGLTPQTFNKDKAKGKARKVTKFALLGLLSQQSQSKDLHQFTPDELSLIFCALLHYTQTRSEKYKQEVIDLRNVVSNLFLEEG